MKVIDYRIIKNTNINTLEVLIKNMLAKGYTPIGGPLTYVDSWTDMQFAQAMVKYEDVPGLLKELE